MRLGTTVEAVFKFLGVFAEMLGRNPDMRRVDRRFEVTPKAFDAVHGRALKADIFARAVVDRHMAIALRVQPAIAVQLIGMQLPAGKHVRCHEGL